MKVINNHTYSRERFDEYEYRAQFKIELIQHDEYPINLDIYTTNTDKDGTYKEVLNSLQKEVYSFKLVNWASRQQDDDVSKMIEEWFKEIEEDNKSVYKVGDKLHITLQEKWMEELYSNELDWDVIGTVWQIDDEHVWVKRRGLESTVRYPIGWINIERWEEF
jgi:hypothetical protein